MPEYKLARSLDAIIQELDAGYNPSRQLINQKLAALPGQAQSEISGLQATQANAFNDIVANARDRGLGFSGIPIAEQAKYTSSSFLPAVARVKQSQNEAQTSLTDALNQTNLEQRKTAMSLRESEMNRDEQQRQFNEQLAAQRRAAAASRASSAGYSGGYVSGSAGAPQPAAQQRQGGGFNFADASGRSVSAAKFAQLTGKPIGEVLFTMGKSGDRYAQQLYNTLKNDPFFGKGNAGYDARIKKAYQPIFWGT